MKRENRICKPRAIVSAGATAEIAWLARLTLAADAEKGKQQRWMRHSEWLRHERRVA